MNIICLLSLIIMLVSLSLDPRSDLSLVMYPMPALLLSWIFVPCKSSELQFESYSPEICILPLISMLCASCACCFTFSSSNISLSSLSTTCKISCSTFVCSNNPTDLEFALSSDLSFGRLKYIKLNKTCN